MSKICTSIVHNGVLGDTRVIKEAKSISRIVSNGYLILGIANESPSKHELGDGVQVELLWEKHPGLSIKNIVKIMMSPVGLLFLALMYFLLGVWVISSISDSIILSLCALALNLYGIYFILSFFSFYVQEKFPFTKIDPIRAGFLLIKSFVAALVKRRKYQRLFLTRLAEIDPDILHAHDLPMLLVALKHKKKFPHVKIIFDAHELFEYMAGRSSLETVLYKLLQKKLIRQADHLITVNESFAEYFKNQYKYPREIYVVKNAVSRTLLKDFKIEKKQSPLWQKVNKPDKKILLYQGGLSLPRGIDILIRSMKEINDKWVLVIMGNGKILEPMMRLSRDLGLRNRVIFMPPAPLSELTNWTFGADVGIIPYLNTCLNHWFCTPNKLWEYPVARVPLIVPKYPELRRVVDQYQIGWLLENVTEKCISTVINSLDDQKILEANKKIDAYVAEESWEVFEERLVAPYKREFQRTSAVSA